MPAYTFKCWSCGNRDNIVSSIKDYPSMPEARCMKCHGEMVRDYRADKPQPAPMWQEHYNPSTGTVVRSRQQLQDDLNRGAEENFNRTGIPSSPVVVDRADMAALAPPEA